MSCSVVTCVYGDHARFLPGWLQAVAALDPAPHEVIVASDRPLELPADVLSLTAPCDWRHPQAFYLNLAIDAAQTDWVLILDVDDRPFPDALEGLDEVAADVWVTGYVRYDGDDTYDLYRPPAFTADDILAAATSIVPGASAIRTEAFRQVGGYRDIAFQDWALWRALARAGASFQSSGRAHYHYNRHDLTRSATELTPERRDIHTIEMYESEGAVVA